MKGRECYDSNPSGGREDPAEPELKTPASYKTQHSCYLKIIGSVFEMPIMEFVLAMEISYFGSVTPSFAKLWE